MMQLTLPQEVLKSSFTQISKNDRLFIYKGLATEPTFIFKRPCAGANWRGHGVYAMAKGTIFAWVNRQVI